MPFNMPVEVKTLNQWFSEVRVEHSWAERLQPGHFFEIKNTRYYIADANDTHVMLIINNAELSFVLESFNDKELQVQYHSLPPPMKNHFYLWRVSNQGLSACLFYFKRYRKEFHGIVFIGTDTHFPFNPAPSQTLISFVPSDAIAALPLFEDWFIPNRLASNTPLPGCFEGSVSSLAEYWLMHSKTQVDFYIDIA